MGKPVNGIAEMCAPAPCSSVAINFYSALPLLPGKIMMIIQKINKYYSIYKLREEKKVQTANRNYNDSPSPSRTYRKKVKSFSDIRKSKKTSVKVENFVCIYFGI